MVVGGVLIIAALALFLWNLREAQEAQKSSELILPQIIEAVGNREDNIILDPYDPKMTEVNIDGNSYIGYLSIPTLGLELPVMSEWNYTKLKIAPCRFYGSTKTGDLVIAAHNYRRHFGLISTLKVGDTIIFKDMDDITWLYEIAAVDVLTRDAVQEMTDGNYDLTLFTCTYGGQNRIAVRCDKISH